MAQAVEELNVKPKNWKDLLDDTPFTRKDIIHLQDPLNLQVGHPSGCALGACNGHLQTHGARGRRSSGGSLDRQTHAAAAWHCPALGKGPRASPPGICTSLLLCSDAHGVGRACAQGKNLDDFDHVRKDLRLMDAEELAAQQADPMHALNAQGLSEDMKRVMAALNSAGASKACICWTGSPCKHSCRTTIGNVMSKMGWQDPALRSACVQQSSVEGEGHREAGDDRPVQYREDNTGVRLQLLLTGGSGQLR